MTKYIQPVALIVIVSADIEKKNSARPNFSKTSDHGFRGFHTSQKLGKCLQVISNYIVANLLESKQYTISSVGSLLRFFQ